MTKANQKVKYSYICPKCKKFHDVTFNMNVTLCDMDDIDEMDITLSGLDTDSACRICDNRMLKIDYDLAPFISAISNMGIGIQATKGEYIRSNEESRIKYKHGSLIKNFDISWASSMTYPAVRIDFDNIDLNEDGTSLNFIESIIDAFKLSDHLDLEYDIFKIDENDNIEDTLCHGNMKYDANLCLLKESILDAIEDLHDNRYTLFIRYPKYAWN